MVNKKNLWFLTLFSLIVVLSIYYITIPDDLLLTANTKNVIKNNTPEISVNSSDILVSLRVDSDASMEKEIEELELILTNADSSIEEKNVAYEKIKRLNNNRGEEEKLERLIKDKFNLESFVKIKDGTINVTIKSEDKGNIEANKIMRSIQETLDTKNYVTIRFQE